MAQVCLNIVATGRGKGKAERRLAKLDELKQAGVYLGYTEYIQKNEERMSSFAAVNRNGVAGESSPCDWVSFNRCSATLTSDPVAINRCPAAFNRGKATLTCDCRDTLRIISHVFEAKWGAGNVHTIEFLAILQ